MTENFDVINAPQFFDFSKNTPDDVDDSFFDNYNELEMEIEAPEDPLKVAESEIENKPETKNERYEEPEVIYIGSDEEESIPVDYDQRFFRRSMSVGDLHYLETALKNATLSSSCKQEEANTIISTEVLKEKQKNNANIQHNLQRPYSACHENVKRSGTLSQRSISKESLNRLAQPKKKFGSDQTMNSSKHLTMAEAVKKFQQGTPERFRTKPKIDINRRFKLANTIPQSPHLISNKRNRPVNAISHEEKERLEFEEAQKFKIKAHPINKKILNGPLKTTVAIEKKPNTVPEPFKLTEVQQKVLQPPTNEIQEFHAKPVPDFNQAIVSKTAYQRKVTRPQTPNILKRYQRTVQEKAQQEIQKEPPNQKQSTKPKTTELQPFSFEARNEQLRRRKENFIQKVYEEEKKAREFHARPMPKAVLVAPKTRNGSFGSAIPVRTNSMKSRTKSQENLSVEFKARPPTVLYKKPFEPKRDERPLTEISEFQLNTDARAREREYFEQQLKEKEERLARAKQLEEQMRLQKEQEEVLRIRRMAEYKAQPIKKYKEVVIQPSGKITEPVSPNFSTKRKDQKGRDSYEENKENSQ